MKTYGYFIFIFIFALVGTANALDVVVISEDYHINVGYEVHGFSPAQGNIIDGFTGTPVVWEDSFTSYSKNSISHDIELMRSGGPGVLAYSTAESGRFQVFTDAYGSTDIEWTDDLGNLVYASHCSAQFLSEAEWTFRVSPTGPISLTGFNILTINYTGGTDYWDTGDDKLIQATILKNGSPYYSEYLFDVPSGVNYVYGTKNIPLINCGTRAIWTLKLKLEGGSWDSDGTMLEVSANLKDVGPKGVFGRAPIPLQEEQPQSIRQINFDNYPVSRE